jgi:3-oxoacyl-[acyl-carrier protein] reductase
MHRQKKTIFISGSSSGIGYHLAREYSSIGYNIIINGKNLSRLKKASLSLGNCDYFLGDLTNKNIIKALIIKIKKKYNYIDILICNLGNSNFKKNDKDFEHALKYNLYTTTNLIEYSKKIFKNNITKIICISSICGVESIDGAPIGYSIAKSALNFYIKLISKELANKNITINGVVPGNIIFKGSTWDLKIKKNYMKTKKYIKNNVPINNFGTPNDIFEVCKMISENRSKFITGSLFKIDGGQTKGF